MVKYVMGWIELHATTTSEYADTLGDQLSSFGAEALTLRDAGGEVIYEPAPGETPTWKKTIVVGLFTDTHTMDPILDYMQSQQNAGLVENFSVVALADQHWERVCLQDFKPLRFGKRLWICPSWETPPDSNGVNIILDPGLAFGTGTSPTTALCLEWLDENVKPGMTAIDYGCGSGILALAALKLGAKQVFAVDYDPQAIIATKDNAEKNSLSAPELETYLPEEFIPRQVDLVIANILAKSLIEMGSFLASLTKPDGKIVLSGILNEQAEQVLEIYREWFDMDAPALKEEWVRLTGVKRKS